MKTVWNINLSRSLKYAQRISENKLAKVCVGNLRTSSMNSKFIKFGKSTTLSQLN